TVQFARIANSEKGLFQRKLTQRYAAISFVVSTIGVAFLLLIPDSFFVWLFGEEFTGIHHLLLLLAPAILSMSLGNIYAHYFAGLGLNRINFWSSLLNLGVMCASFFLLLDSLGADAAPLASSIAFAAAMLYHILRFRLSRSR